MTRIQIRRDTSTNWSVNNPTPANGEPCYETDTRKFKIGDGVTKYTNLPYQGGGSGGGGATIDDSTISSTSTWSSSKINSTKNDIYDAIKANKTELSEFKTETSTDFSAVNSALNEKANLTDLALKQNTLVSGTNIKTINGETILGEGNITVEGSTPANMVTTDTTQDITANKTFYGEIRVAADYNYAILAKFSKEAIQCGNFTILEHIDLGEADFIVKGNLGKKVYETDKYVCKKYINEDDLSDNQIIWDNSISSQVAHMAMPSDKYIDLTIGASGTSYTAPADGWFIFRAPANSAVNSYIDTYVHYHNQLISTATHIVSFTGDTCGFVHQVPKGAVLSLVYTATFSQITDFRFIYAVGSQPTQ